MEEQITDELELAKDQLERMSVSQFQEIFLRGFDSDSFNQDSDLLEFRLYTDSQYGIEKVRWTHQRGYVEGDVATAPIGEDESLELQTVDEGRWVVYDSDEDPRQGGASPFKLLHPVSEPVDGAQIMQGVYEAINELSKSNSPSMKSGPGYPPQPLYQYEDPTTNVTEQIGEPYTVPDTSIHPDDKVERLERDELKDELSKIDLGIPATTLRCHSLPEDCSRTGDLPDDPWDAPDRYDEEREKAILRDGDDVRGVAAIKLDTYDETEEWDILDVWHAECGPEVEEFRGETGRGASLGKHEALVDAVLEQGDLQKNPVGDYYSFYLTEIEILEEQGSLLYEYE